MHSAVPTARLISHSRAPADFGAAAPGPSHRSAAVLSHSHCALWRTILCEPMRWPSSSVARRAPPAAADDSPPPHREAPGHVRAANRRCRHKVDKRKLSVGNFIGTAGMQFHPKSPYFAMGDGNSKVDIFPAQGKSRQAHRPAATSGRLSLWSNRVNARKMYEVYDIRGSRNTAGDRDC